MKSADIRKAFLDYFEKHDHKVLPSSSLVPGDDPTLLFTNAGMVQFKEVFLGQEVTVYPRVATSQRCVRAGGKHNDLENVGHTARHHTFFEMLGNFSFGDYFKSVAIKLAWQFLTVELKIPVEKLWVTVFQDDDEAADIWRNEIGLDADRVIRCGEKDNFWSMGDVGPCGPCTEIFYDHGPHVAGGLPGTSEQEGDRYIEVWNLVFMQYNRHATGELTPLSTPSVDTGMGLERIAAVMQGVHSNYEIDLFQAIIQSAASIMHVEDLHEVGLKVIADHVRSAAFLIADGVVPGNEGRHYVLRRVIRRALRHGYQLGVNEPFFYKLIKITAEQMGEAYPMLVKSQAYIEKIILKEEEQFLMTLDRGLAILEEDIKLVNDKIIPGETVFKLYDTYGFPVDLTADIARDKGLTIDEAGFKKAMTRQRAQSKQASQFSTQSLLKEALAFEGKTHFKGYETLSCEGKVVALLTNKAKSVDALQDESGVVILDQTPFYAESGGQVGDAGEFIFNGAASHVENTIKLGDAHAHMTNIAGKLVVGDVVMARVDEERRHATMYNHSATHLLNAALRIVLGEHVLQKGSLVDAKHLRFDFSHHSPLTEVEHDRIEALVNEAIMSDLVVTTHHMSPESAKAAGALFLAGEKYADEVRVLSMGEFSKELCGGTHVATTGDIRHFKIVTESGVAAGVRRIVAVTHEAVDEHLLMLEEDKKLLLQNLQSKQVQLLSLLGEAELAAGIEVEDLAVPLMTLAVDAQIEGYKSVNRQLEKRLERAKAKIAVQKGGALSDKAIEVHGVFVLVERLDGVDSKALRDTIDQLKNKLKSAVIVLAAVNGDKIQLVAGVTIDQTARFKAGDLVAMVASQVGGSGGGRADMAQAGGSDIDALPAALDSVMPWVIEHIGDVGYLRER